MSPLTEAVLYALGIAAATDFCVVGCVVAAAVAGSLCVVSSTTELSSTVLDCLLSVCTVACSVAVVLSCVAAATDIGNWLTPKNIVATKATDTIFLNVFISFLLLKYKLFNYNSFLGF